MKKLTNADSFQVLLLQLADEGRGQALLGESVDRAREATLPFLLGEQFPSTYFEFPLTGDPFLDITLLYDKVERGARIQSSAALGTGTLLDWYAEVGQAHDGVSLGFELDTSKPKLERAAVHFQPRSHVGLVRPFCEAVGEPERASLYLDLAARMPEGWPLSFFGMFRGRPGTPLRVCGYLDQAQARSCAADSRALVRAFDAIGFKAYDDAMVAEVRSFMEASTVALDFQFDVYPDGHLGDVFALDIQLGIERTPAVRESFESGPAARVMGLFERLGAADERWRQAAGAAFARWLPIVDDDGRTARRTFTLMPQWVKARWISGALQPGKLYYLGKAGILDSRGPH